MWQGLRLHVRDSGAREAPAVILLHGFGSSLHTWEPLARALSGEYRVIRFDLPGFGLTGVDPSGDYTDARSVQVLGALMDRLGLPRASLIGNSIGGKIAWNFAALHPDRVDKLVLISPDGFASPGFEYGKKPQVPPLVRLMRYALPVFMVRQSLAPAYGDPAALTDELVTRYRDLMLAPGVRGAMIARMEQVMLADPVPMLRQIRAPTLLLWGEKDAMIPVANAADYLKSSARRQAGDLSRARSRSPGGGAGPGFSRSAQVPGGVRPPTGRPNIHQVASTSKRSYSAAGPLSIPSRRSFTASPPANPVNAPLEPITRWQGAMIEIGFLPLAAPTARTAVGLPICRAIAP